MLFYLARRLLLAVPTVIGVTFLVFMLVALSPGGLTGAVIADPASGDAEARLAHQRALEQRYGLGDPLLVQYGRWLHRVSPIRFGGDRALRLAPPDLGQSIVQARPVADLVAEALPVTLMLNALALAVTLTIALPTGIIAARRRGTWIDAALRALLVTLWSVPVVAAAAALYGVFASPAGLAWLPPSGLHRPDADALPFFAYLLDSVRHLVLPVACLSYGSLALLSRHTRSAVLEHMNADHVRAARATGLSEPALFARHVLRNSLLPLITLLSAIVPTLLSGSIIVERVFNIPGMGLLLLDAVDRRDREVLMACVLVAALVTILSMLIADVLYATADPRVTFERRP